MNTSTMRNLTTEELVLSLDEKRHHSPIIHELCLRLEQELQLPEHVGGRQVECPICMAQLLTEHDLDNDIISLEKTK